MKDLIGKLKLLQTNYLSLFDNFVELALKSWLKFAKREVRQVANEFNKYSTTIGSN